MRGKKGSSEGVNSRLVNARGASHARREAQEALASTVLSRDLCRVRRPAVREATLRDIEAHGPALRRGRRCSPRPSPRALQVAGLAAAQPRVPRASDVERALDVPRRGVRATPGRLGERRRLRGAQGPGVPTASERRGQRPDRHRFVPAAAASGACCSRKPRSGCGGAERRRSSSSSTSSTTARDASTRRSATRRCRARWRSR